jgi:glycosyltransferase involved in cell wall biosynthesis
MNEVINVDLIRIVNEVKIQNLPKLLLIGRIRDYKGLNHLLEEFRSINSKFTLLIAGEGSAKAEMPANVFFLNRWLNRIEFEHLIDFADIVLFPYSEASQSGILPIAIAKNKKIVVSTAPGLLEQSSGSQNSISFEIDKPGDLAHAIQIISRTQLPNADSKSNPNKIMIDEFVLAQISCKT